MPPTTLGELRRIMAKDPSQRTAEDNAAIEEARPAFAQAGEAVRSIQSALARMNDSVSSAHSSMPASDWRPPLGIRMTPEIDEFIHGEARAKAASRDREVAMLESLQAIRGALEGVADTIASHDQRLKRHEEELIRLRTGGPGRPSAMHLITKEFRLRVGAGRVEPTLSDQARSLLTWLEEKHPEAAAPTEKTVCNRIRSEYRQVADGGRKRSTASPSRHRNRRS